MRELEGALNTILCQSQLLGRMLTLDEVKVLIKNSTRPRKSLAVSDVVDKIARYFDIEPASIYEKTRRKEVVKPRQLIMYILREDFQVSYPAIGQKLGGRDHTTVIHSCEKIKNDLKEDIGPATIQNNSLPAPVPVIQNHPVILDNEIPTHYEIDESLNIMDKEKELILKALKKHKGRRKDASTDLGISERTLYRKIKEYDIEE